jgi:hypothetical protein
LTTGEYFMEEVRLRDCGASVALIVSSTLLFNPSITLHKLYNQEKLTL